MQKQPANARRLKARRFGQPPASEVTPAGPTPGRDAHGRFIAGNPQAATAALTTGLRSQRVASALEPVRQSIVRSVLDSQGYSDHHPPAPAFLALVVQFARLQVHLDHLETYLDDSGGLLSRKGHVRRAVTVYLGLHDRLARLAQLVGLTHVPRPVTSALDQLHAEARAFDADVDGEVDADLTADAEAGLTETADNVTADPDVNLDPPADRSADAARSTP